MNVMNENMLDREEALARIDSMATEQGMENYKVFYSGQQVNNPGDLPGTVDMTLVELTAALDQA